VDFNYVFVFLNCGRQQAAHEYKKPPVSCENSFIFQSSRFPKFKNQKVQNQKMSLACEQVTLILFCKKR